MATDQNEAKDDAFTGAAAKAAAMLRDEVPVRSSWRDALLARIAEDERHAGSRRRGWTFAPSVAIAAGVALIMVGAGAMMLLDPRDVPRSGATQASVPARSVRFVVVAPGAANVSVVGDFNQWKAGAEPLRRLDDGRTWIADVALAPGRYAYAFMVDGKVVADPAAPHATSDDFGVTNSILMVRGL